MDRILSAFPGQPSIPTASIAATPIGLFAQTPPSMSSTFRFGHVRLEKCWGGCSRHRARAVCNPSPGEDDALSCRCRRVRAPGAMRGLQVECGFLRAHGGRALVPKCGGAAPVRLYPVVFTGCTPPYSNSAMWSFVSAPVSRRGYFFHRPIIDELLSPVIGEALRFRSPLSACSASLSSCLRSASKLALAAESFVAAALIAHLRANCRRYSGRALMQHATSAGLSSETGTAPPFHCEWRQESDLFPHSARSRDN